MKFYFIDLFCGAGGVTTGVHRATYNGKNIAEVIACVNHDPTAILSHTANHPDVLHYTEDIRTLDLTELAELVQLTRLKDPDAVICLWASLECTNFSKAKGGLPRDADSRTLAEHLIERPNHQGGFDPAYIPVLKPDMIWIENVEEFMSWGPLDDKGKPFSRHNGRDYIRWTNAVQNLGYSFEHRILNAADFGAYTSRKRYFAQFVRNGIEIHWPQPTHGKKAHSDVFSNLKKWKPVREVLNLDETGESIFIPGRIKSDKTFERIYHGLIKFVAGGKKEFESFLLKWNSTSSDGKGVKNCTQDLEQPAPTVSTQNRLGLINPVFILQRKSGAPLSKLVSVEGPARTVTTTGGNQELVTAEWLMKYFSGHPEHKNISLDGPAGAIRTKDGTALMQAEFIMNPLYDSNCTDSKSPLGTITASRRHWHYLIDPQWSTRNGSSAKDLNDPCHTIMAKGATPYLISMHHSDKSASVDAPIGSVTCKDKKAFISAYFGNGHNCSGIDNPHPSITTGDRFVLVSPQFLYRQFSNGGESQSTESPAGSIGTVPKLNLVTPQFLMDTQFSNDAKSIDEPAPTQTADRHHYYLMDPQWFNQNGRSIEEPCFTIIARQDKSPAYLICAESGFCAIEVFENDLPHAILIKAFMVLYGIVDIKMRMLQIIELLRIQGFITEEEKEYILLGTKTKQKWMLGNSCECNNIQALVEASYKGNYLNSMIAA